MTLQQPKVHGPAKTGSPKVRVLLLPSGVAKLNLCPAVLLFEAEADPGSLPVAVGNRHLEFKRDIRRRSTYPRLPAIIGSKIQLINLAG